MKKEKSKQTHILYWWVQKKEDPIIYADNPDAQPVIAKPYIPFYRRYNLVMFVLAALLTIAVIWAGLIPHYYYSIYTYGTQPLACETGSLFYTIERGKRGGYMIGLDTIKERSPFSCAIGAGGQVNCIAPADIKILEGKQVEICWSNIQIHINQVKKFPIVIRSGEKVYADRTVSEKKLKSCITDAKNSSLALSTILLVPIFTFIYRGMSNHAK